MLHKNTKKKIIINEVRSRIIIRKKLIPYSNKIKEKKKKKKEGRKRGKEEILCHGDKACISESRRESWKNAGGTETSSWVVISVHAKGNPWRDLSHVSATKKNRKTVLESLWPGAGRLRWLRNDKETKEREEERERERYRQKYTKPSCGRQGEARVRFEDLDVLFDRHVRRRPLREMLR